MSFNTQLLLFGLFGLALLACSDEPNTKHTEGDQIINEITSKGSFNNWLRSIGLTHQDFIDTISMEVFELWAYSEKITARDSMMKWLPSTDSSYVLLTNFGTNTPTNGLFEDGDVHFQFLPKDSMEIFVGFTIRTGKSNGKILDTYWFDDSTLFILQELPGTEFELSKVSPKVDSLFFYNTKKP